MDRSKGFAPFARGRAIGPLLAIGLALALPATAMADYSLFNPVPEALMRPMSTDRPDLTESPYTVDAGHWQVEFDFFNVARDEEGSIEARAFSLIPTNVKVGLHPRVDAQFIVQPYVRTTVDVPGLGKFEDSGIGDSALRLKINLIGNDDGSAALGLLPFVTLPTGGDDRGAGDAGFGLAVPLALQIEGGTTASFMVQGASVGDVSSWLFTAAFGRTIAGSVAGFLEFAGELPVVDGESGDWRTTLNAGLTVGLSKDVQLDGAVNIGLDDAATDFVGYLGMSFRR